MGAKTHGQGEQFGQKIPLPHEDQEIQKELPESNGKGLWKTEVQKEFPNPNEIVTIGYTPFFKSFRTMKKTWLDNNESIEILPVEQ